MIEDDERYVPGLGMVSIYEAYSGYVKVAFELHEDDLKDWGIGIDELPFCGGCEGYNQDRLKDDYICLDCRMTQHNMSFHADPEWLRATERYIHPDQLTLDTALYGNR